MRQAGIGAAQIGRYLRMQHRKALDVQLVNYRLVPRDVQLGIVAPVEVGIDDYALRDERRTVAIVAAQVFVGMTDRVAEQRIVPAQEPVDGLGIGINQQFRRIETMPVVRIVGSVHPIAVSQTRLHALQIDMPDTIGLFGNRYSRGFQIFVAIIVETKLYAGRVFAEQRKVYARPIPVRPLRVRVPGHRSDCAIHRTTTSH